MSSDGEDGRESQQDLPTTPEAHATTSLSPTSCTSASTPDVVLSKVAANIDVEESQPVDIDGGSSDSELDWAPRKKKKKMCDQESGPSKVETFLHSTKASKKAVDHRRLKLEALQAKIEVGENRLEAQRQQFELKLVAEQQKFMATLEEKRLEADRKLKLMEQEYEDRRELERRKFEDARGREEREYKEKREREKREYEEMRQRERISMDEDRRRSDQQFQATLLAKIFANK